MRTLGDRLFPIAVVAALCLAGFWLGRSTVPPPTQAASPAAADRQARPGRAPIVHTPRAPSIETIRAEIDSGLRDALATRAASESAGSPPEALPTQPSVEQQEALDRAHELLDSVIDAGQFTHDDRRAFDDLVAQLPNEHKAPLLSRLFVGVNAQQVIPELP